MNLQKISTVRDLLASYRREQSSHIDRHRIDHVLAVLDRDIHSRHIIRGDYARDDHGERL